MPCSTGSPRFSRPTASSSRRDRIGYGFSDPYDEPPEVFEYALATLDALDALDVERFDVYGLHSGACESIELCTAHPERIHRVGLSGILGFPTPEEAIEFVYAVVSRGVPPAAPAEDGSHLQWRWDRRMRWRSSLPEQDLAAVQRHLVDELLCAPHQNMTTIDSYPWVERLASIRQPLLMLVAHDYLLEPTRRALSSVPTARGSSKCRSSRPERPRRRVSSGSSPHVLAAHLCAFFDSGGPLAPEERLPAPMLRHGLLPARGLHDPQVESALLSAEEVHRRACTHRPVLDHAGTPEVAPR